MINLKQLIISFVITFYRHAEKENEVKTKLFSSHVGSRVQEYYMYTRLLA